MKTSRQYIQKALRSFIKVFSNARVRYEYDERALVHFVEVVPNDLFRSNENYVAWESAMCDNFIKRYPTENICFLSDDATVPVENPELVLEGKSYRKGLAPAEQQERAMAGSKLYKPQLTY
ncbi:MAG: hypothetical protein LBB79_04190 [Prevotellaceae bacterium]|jgi:hypothetical protein|nr:hypothetical protein [Prevotellaceae bacterium]